MASSAYATDHDEIESAPPPARLSVTDLLMVCMALLWGVNFIVVKFATGIFAPLAFNGARVLLAVVVLWTIFFVRRADLPSRRDVGQMLMLGMLGNGLYQILWIEGMARTRASDAALLIAASPAFIEIIGWIRGTERTGARGMAGIGLSLGGIALIVSAAPQGPNSSSLAGNALILGSVLCWSVYSVALRRFTTNVEGLTLSAVTMTGGLLPILLVGTPALLTTQWSAVGTVGWAAIFYSGIIALVVAYLFFYRGVRVLGPTRAAMYSNLQPLIAMIAAWALLSEVPHMRQIMGGLLIVGGLLLTRMSGRQPVAVAHE